MVISIARQSVILKCLRQKSVLIGNYEFYYLAGLMEQLFHLGLHGDMAPEELFGIISKNLDQLEPQNDQEKYLISLVRFYETLPQQDEQMKQLFEWGLQEQDMWKVQTRVGSDSNSKIHSETQL